MLVGFCEVSSDSFDRPPSSNVASRLRNSKTKPTDEVRFFDLSAGPCCDRPQLPRVRRAPRSIVKSAGKSGFKMRAGSGRTARVCGALIGNFIDTRSRLKAVDRSHSSRSSVHRSDTCRPFYGESGTGRKPKNRVVIGPYFVNNFLPVFLDSALVVLHWSRSFTRPLLPRATRTCTSSVEAHKGNERIFVRTPNSKQRAIVLA